MAQVFYGKDRGQTEFEIVQDAATQGTDIELRYDTTKNLEKNEILIALDEIKNRILKDNFPV